MAAQVSAPMPPSAEAGLSDRSYEHQDTRDLVELVREAAALVRTKGAAAFDELRVAGSRWRRGEQYVFVLDVDGNMLVHPDPALEGRNTLDLTDVNGKPIIRGLIGAATAVPDKPQGWYHYQWVVPGGLLPRWKSSYVERADTPSGRSCIVGSGTYNDRMERAFVVDLVMDAVACFEREGQAAFPLFRDPGGPFVAKDAYVFVLDSDGREIVNPAFPTLEGRSLLDFRDSNGRYPIREMLAVVDASGAGWVDYMWPKPGESVATQKSAYVSRAMADGNAVVVGCGVYLADAPKAVPTGGMTGADLVSLVREAGALLEQQGDTAFTDLRKKGSKWRHDDTYFFAWTLEGTCVFNAAEPEMEGRNGRELTDALGRPIGRMLIEAGATPSGEGWIHFVSPQPGNIFPTWKSAFVKRIVLASGTSYLLGSGIYNMTITKPFVQDLVERAAELIAAKGTAAFQELRDRKGPFTFMDTYVFVASSEGTELVNPAFPSLEGRNLIGLCDLRGTAVVKQEIDAALGRGAAWVDVYWFKPGTNAPALKHTYVRSIESGGRTFIVGCGMYD